MKQTKSALILVDLQNDFCEGGSLAVPGANEVIPIANQLQPYFSLIVATQDWHPTNHMSFAANHPGKKVGDEILVDDITQVLWPVRCVQETHGAAFHSALETRRITKISHKGSDPLIDSYSAFFDNEHKRSTGLSDYLKTQKIEDIFIMGLATDYCVKYSALDAIHLGFKVYVVIDACRGVNLHVGDIEQAVAEMQQAGVKTLLSQEIIEQGTVR